MEEVRLQKYLAEQGLASRRKCEVFIAEGRVKVNGNVITELGTKVNVQKDKIEFDGKLLSSNEKKVYILLNKPIGYITTVKDQFGRPTVMDLLKGVKEKVVPVGRLDMYTSGAILLSNDGEFVYQVTHPKFEVEKTYVATVKGVVEQAEIEILKNGIKIEDYITGKAKVKIKKYDKEKDITRLEIIIHEGKNREVRKMCEAIGKKVIALHRTRIGNLEVKDLELGTWRYLTHKEINQFAL